MTGKPQRPDDGALCPLWRDKCSKRCHTCDWWVPLPATHDGKEVTEWRCAQVWAAVGHAINAKRMDGQQKAAEELRNNFASFADGQVNLIKQLAGVRRDLDALPIIPRDGGKLIEGH